MLLKRLTNISPCLPHPGLAQIPPAIELQRITAEIDRERQTQLHRLNPTPPPTSAPPWYVRVFLSFVTDKPPEVNVGKLADGVVGLMGLFNRAETDDKAARIQFVDVAFSGLLTIERELRGESQLEALRPGKEPKPRQEPKPREDCIVCCERPADTVVMPCKHLALCMVGFPRTDRILWPQAWWVLLAG